MKLTGTFNSPDKISKAYSLAGTIVFWIFLLIIMLVIKPAEKPKKYKEVQIVLDAVPVKKQVVAEKSQESVAPKAAQAETVADSISESSASQNSPSAPSVSQESPVKNESKPAPVKKTEPAKTETKTVQKPSETKVPKKEPAKTQPVKQAPKPVPVEPVYAKSVDDALNFDSNKKVSKQSDFDWSVFGSDETETPKSASTQKKVQSESSMEGTAGTGASSSSGPVSSQSKNQNEGKKSASDGTKQNLADIGSASFIGTSLGAIDGDSAGSDDYVFDGKSFKGSNGRTRGLLTPAVINITEHADQITNSEVVEIRFIVLGVGLIDKSSIEISPPVLTRAVKDEIIAQLMKWKFSPDSEDAAAVFSLNIVKK